MPLTRRGFLVGSLAALAAGRLETASALASPVAPRSFLSRPDLRPPAVAVNTNSPTVDPGHIFVAPFEISGTAGPGYGPLIVDRNGEPIWFKPEKSVTAMGLRVQQYKGRPVLTWYQGDVLGGYGGDYVIADSSYRVLHTVKATNGEHGDLHEFLLTSRGSALITIYSNIPADLTSVGGTTAGQLTEGVIQEIDIATGKVLLEWRSMSQIPLSESVLPSLKNDVADYFHLNSIGVDTDGNLLVSARHTSTVYKLDRKTGEIIWRLGGTQSDFTIIPGAEFSFQHDVRRHSDGTLTIFDNNATLPAATTRSRPIRLALDMQAMTARLVAEYQPSAQRTSWAMGNVQQLPDGGAFVGWGTAGAFTEFAPDGTVRFDATFADGTSTYRAFRSPWVGKPAAPPAVAITRNASGLTAHVSWNGATEVARWRAEIGAFPNALHPVATVRRTGFETAVPLGRWHGFGFVSLVALDGHGARLGASLIHRLT